MAILKYTLPPEDELQFLAYLENDISAHPENIIPVSVAYWERIKALTTGVEVDLDTPLTDD
jgi:antitoxin PrlF